MTLEQKLTRARQLRKAAMIAAADYPDEQAAAVGGGGRRPAVL